MFFEAFIAETVTKIGRSDIENELLQFYFDNILNTHANHTITLWFLKNEPLTIYPYIDQVIKGSCRFTSYRYRKGGYMHDLYFREIKQYSHLDFDIKYAEFYKKQLSNVDADAKEDIVKNLSRLLPTENFVKLIEEHYLPKKGKLDLQDEDMKKNYKLQCEVAKLLKGVTEPFKMLPTVIKFCTGDYLQSALPSLYSIFYRSPENQLYLHLDTLSKKAISVCKHSISLSCALLDYNYAVNVLNTIGVKHISSQTHIFRATLKYFLKNPSQKLLDIVILNMQKIDKNDSESLESLKSEYLPVNIPKKYHAVYIENCWQFFENIRRKEVKVSKYLQSLLLHILGRTDILQKLSSEFCKNIISRYFLQQTDHLLNTELFTCNVLRYREVEQVNNFNFVFEIVSAFKCNSKMGRIKIFFEKFYAFAIEEVNSNFIKLFSEHWNQLFTPLEMFDEFVLLKLLTLRCDSPEPFNENYAKNVVTFFEQLISAYTLLVYNKFKCLLIKALDWQFEGKKDKYLFFYNILKFKVTAVSGVLVLDLMPKADEDDSQEVKKAFYDTLQILKDIEEPIVQIHYKSYINKTDE